MTAGPCPETALSALEEARADIQAWFHDLLSVFVRHAQQVSSLIDAAGREHVVEEDLGPFVDSIGQWLSAHQDVAIGAGFMAAAGVVPGQDRYALWYLSSCGQIERLQFNLDPQHVDVYDYPACGWFARPQQLQKITAIGPYIDYTGSETVVIRVAFPVVLDGEFLGVVGSDLSAESVERAVLPKLARGGYRFALVNNEGCVVASASADLAPGVRLRPGHPPPLVSRVFGVEADWTVVQPSTP